MLAVESAFSCLTSEKLEIWKEFDSLIGIVCLEMKLLVFLMMHCLFHVKRAGFSQQLPDLTRVETSMSLQQLPCASLHQPGLATAVGCLDGRCSL
ncbi:hypothetical protein PoB_002736200 [Plakobranchus ocellatus]|uniref:Uncharacterized protein n=1 Tax=Plakobranchus ocellatus TaxID=259542 RepID=A0AAV4A1S7_9GAST|nr:hypothetical protein PoB_002736200 [Plakobranchus ocellatus]